MILEEWHSWRTSFTFRTVRYPTTKQVCCLPRYSVCNHFWQFRIHRVIQKSFRVVLECKNSFLWLSSEAFHSIVSRISLKRSRWASIWKGNSIHRECDRWRSYRCELSSSHPLWPEFLWSVFIRTAFIRNKVGKGKIFLGIGDSCEGERRARHRVKVRVWWLHAGFVDSRVRLMPRIQ